MSEFDNDKAIYGYQFTPPTDGNSFGLDFGVAYTFNKLETGISLRNVLKSNDVAQYLEGEKRFNWMAQYTFGKEDGFQFFPKAMVVSGIEEHQNERYLDNANLYINGKLGYKNKYFLGAGIAFNNFGSMSIEVLLYQKVRLAYSYQYTVSKLSSVSAPSHEFGASLEIGKR